LKTFPLWHVCAGIGGGIHPITYGQLGAVLAWSVRAQKITWVHSSKCWIGHIGQRLVQRLLLALTLIFGEKMPQTVVLVTLTLPSKSGVLGCSAGCGLGVPALVQSARSQPGGHAVVHQDLDEDSPPVGKQVGLARRQRPPVSAVSVPACMSRGAVAS